MRRLLELGPETPTIISFSQIIYLIIKFTSISVCVLRTQTCTIWGDAFLFETLLGDRFEGTTDLFQLSGLEQRVQTCICQISLLVFAGFIKYLTTLLILPAPRMVQGSRDQAGWGSLGPAAGAEVSTDPQLERGSDSAQGLL